MASITQRETLDIDEQITRIEKMQAELSKVMIETRKIAQDITLAKPHLFLQGGLAAAALIGATVAVAKLFPHL